MLGKRFAIEREDPCRLFHVYLSQERIEDALAVHKEAKLPDDLFLQPFVRAVGRRAVASAVSQGKAGDAVRLAQAFQLSEPSPSVTHDPIAADAWLNRAIPLGSL